MGRVGAPTWDRVHTKALLLTAAWAVFHTERSFSFSDASASLEKDVNQSIGTPIKYSFNPRIEANKAFWGLPESTLTLPEGSFKKPISATDSRIPHRPVAPHLLVG